MTFTVTFSEPVTGVDASDFSLVSTGNITTGSTLVSAVNGSVYNVTVNGVVGNGTLGLNVVDNGSIKDLANSYRIRAVPSSPEWTLPPPGRLPTRRCWGMNGDGNPDIAFANAIDMTVSVLLGFGDGTFADQQTYRVASQPDPWSWPT